MKDPRSYNVGKSDYSKRKIHPWDLWIEYDLNPFDADIVKRVLRTKEGESRILDYKKIIHVCEERIRQLQEQDDNVFPDHVRDTIKATRESVLGLTKKGFKDGGIVPVDSEKVKEELKKATCPQWKDFLEGKLNDL